MAHSERQAGVEITPEMIEAGAAALYEVIGYQFNGDPRDAAEHVFKQMSQAAGEGGSKAGKGR